MFLIVSAIAKPLGFGQTSQDVDLHFSEFISVVVEPRSLCFCPQLSQLSLSMCASIFLGRTKQYMDAVLESANKFSKHSQSNLDVLQPEEV